MAYKPPSPSNSEILRSVKSHYSKFLFLSLKENHFTSPGWMHETSSRTWCTGKTQRDQAEREVGGEIGMGNTCKTMADSCQCMTKTTMIL